MAKGKFFMSKENPELMERLKRVMDNPGLINRRSKALSRFQIQCDISVRLFVQQPFSYETCWDDAAKILEFQEQKMAELKKDLDAQENEKTTND
jgi:hypothetical protein